MTKLEKIIRDEIRTGGPMRFDRFMDLALYCPGLGYYAKIGGPSPVGRSGDFYTSVSAGPLFGRLLARQFLQMWRVLEKPAPFWIIEQGAHDGQLARDILEWCRAEAPDFLEVIRYGLVDTSGGGSIRQKCGLDVELAPYMTWFENLESLAEAKPVGVFFSNELVDAFPVRAIIYKSNQWRESFVGMDGQNALVWTEETIEDLELQREIAARSIPAMEGYSTEINLRALDWMKGVGQIFQRGYVLTIDYGYPASVYYADFRTGGTLTAYVKHHALDDVLAEPGMRDLTAHVDFTALARAGEQAGLTTLGFVDQQRFLMGLAHDELSGAAGPQVKIRENLPAWNTLTHPDHLGATFYALLQMKNAPAELDGLRFARPGRAGMNRRLPVTLVGGFFGAGKTSLLHHFISGHRGGHLAVLVENPGALNLDAKALGGLCGAMRRAQDAVLEIPNGDEATQVGWIAERLREFSLAGRFERVLIEVSGTANAARLGECFGLLPGQPETFAPWADLHQIVCVVDALDFYRDIVAPSRKDSATPEDLLDFQRAQIEGASLLVLNKCDLVDEAEKNACTSFLRSINPNANLIETAYGEVPPEMLSRLAAPRELGLAVEHRVRPQTDRDAPELERTESVLASALYRAYRPFHPGRFWDWYDAVHPGLFRVKGLIWLATRNLLVGGVSRTRWQNSCGAAGIWWAALPREEWPEEPEALMRMQKTWREPYGDRRQELVLIGDASLLSGLMPQLDACLLNAEEYARPVAGWTALPDPFPAWDLEEG